MFIRYYYSRLIHGMQKRCNLEMKVFDTIMAVIKRNYGYR
nr:MAG TPA: hypothetical protein [Caudoviricetes sp.]